jgi:hypothetical protein
MHQHIASTKLAPFGLTNPSPPSGAHRKRQRAQAYPILAKWPDLAPAVAVHLGMGTTSAIRVPIKLMRKCGMYPELGVDVALYKDCAILRGDNRGGAYAQDDESKQFILSPAGLDRAVVRGDVAIIEGPDYLVLTTRATALRRAPTARVIEKSPWKRMEQGVATVVDLQFDPEGVTVLAWKDVKLCRSNNKRVALVANVSGHLWLKAGFEIGDALRFTRYGNATVVEKCDADSAQSTLARSSAETPRHYFGASLVDIRDTDRVRVVATPGRLIITKPGTEIAGLCVEELHQQRAVLPLASGPLLEASTQLQQLDVASIGDILYWKNYSPVEGRFTVTGRPWSIAGFGPREPSRIIHYANAIVVERCDEEHMDFRVGTKSQKHPYRNIGVAGTALQGLSTVRVLATNGRLIVTESGRNLAKLAIDKAAWGTDAQVATVERRCFSLIDTGRLVNRNALQAGIPHSTPRAYRKQELLKRHRHQNSDAAPRGFIGGPVFRLNPRRAEDMVPVGPGRPSSLTLIAQSAPRKPLTVADVVVHGWKDLSLLRGRVVIAGRIWSAAGFETNQPARLLFHSNALVVEPCAESVMDFRVGSPSREEPYRNVGLNGFGFGHLESIRVVASRGRLIITPPDSAIGRHCRAEAAWPSSVEGVLELLEALSARQEPSAKEVTSYTVPVGRRLQIQGKWLSQFGFKPGANFVIRKCDGELHLELCSEHCWTVTEHSPGSSKLYVPAPILETLNTEKVRVLGREGLLRLVPFAV